MDEAVVVVTAYVTRGEVPPLVKLMRPIPFVPANLSADRLVSLLREEHTSKAIVVDEYGNVQGMISVDDLLAELFGELGDELKASSSVSAEMLVDGRVKLRGSMRAVAAEPWLGQRLEGTAGTLGGLIVSQLGRLPLPGEKLELCSAEVTVLEVSPTAVLSVAVQKRAAAAQEENV